LSAGSFEDWRPDAASFPDDVKGMQLQKWNETWLDIRKWDPVLKGIMAKRMELAADKGGCRVLSYSFIQNESRWTRNGWKCPCTLGRFFIKGL
jgi:hypothetical protein